MGYICSYLLREHIEFRNINVNFPMLVKPNGFYLDIGRKYLVTSNSLLPHTTQPYFTPSAWSHTVTLQCTPTLPYPPTLPHSPIYCSPLLVATLNRGHPP